MYFPKILVLSVLLSSSFACLAENVKNTNQPVKPTTETKKVPVLGKLKFNDLSFDLAKSFSQFKDSVESFNNDVYINWKNDNMFPSIKIDYVSNSFQNKGTLNNSLASSLGMNPSKSTNLDINVQQADLVSYYSLRASNNYTLDLGIGLRQYTGEVSLYQTATNNITSDINTTVPITYMDFYYTLENSNSKIGTYVKEARMIDDAIQDSAIYYSTKIRHVDNMNLIASYSISNLNFGDSPGTQAVGKDYSELQSKGFNLQLIYSY